MCPNQQQAFTNELAIINARQLKAEKPLNVLVTSVTKVTQRMLAKKQAYKWAVNFKELPVEKMADKDSLVYLTSDSPKILKKFDPKLVN